MRRTILAIAAVVVVVAIAATYTGTRAARADEGPGVPDYAVGDGWTFAADDGGTTFYNVTGVRDGHLELTMRSLAFDQSLRKAQVNLMDDEARIVGHVGHTGPVYYDEPVVLFPFPLHAKAAGGLYPASSAGSETDGGRLTVEVTGTGTVTVPAGTFEVYIIERHQTADGVTVDEELAYAPEVGFFVERTTLVTLESGKTYSLVESLTATTR